MGSPDRADIDHAPALASLTRLIVFPARSVTDVTVFPIGRADCGFQISLTSLAVDLLATTRATVFCVCATSRAYCPRTWSWRLSLFFSQGFPPGDRSNKRNVFVISCVALLTAHQLYMG